ncbi:hypothetical protein OEZ85_008017 [Tetradesmus obliquus]|uniref:Uncharacterized protein n=1 Tax=Tetradesmus obliquus TaxID=3088 RepID=A0ABY8TJN4_TETOB|nr:hypothetical protein OEZ85_008017 [Tetradesmus obliquus]
MDREAKPEDTLHTVAKLFNVQPVFYNTPTIVREQVPGAMLMDPYKAPKADEEIIGYELYYPRDPGGPFACHVTGLSWIDACFDGCCNPCAFGPLGALLCIGGCNLCAAMFLKQNQRMCQRAVYGKKGTDITKLVPHSSMLYIEGVNEKKA